MSYVVSDELYNNACKFCAPLFIVKEQPKIEATSKDSSATITFIKFQGRTYGITCKHIVETLKDRIRESGQEFSYTFFIGLETHHVIQNRFTSPLRDFDLSEPDIAVCELHPDFPAHIGKDALDIDAHPVPPLLEVSFAVAVGFPDRLKTQKSMPLGHQLKMPCLHVVADNKSKSGASHARL